MGPVGRVPPTLYVAHGDQVYLDPPAFVTGCHFFAGQCGKLRVFPQTTLLNLREKERKVGKGMDETWAEQ